MGSSRAIFAARYQRECPPSPKVQTKTRDWPSSLRDVNAPSTSLAFAQSAWTIWPPNWGCPKRPFTATSKTSGEIDKILNKSIYDHITENKLNILGNPLPIEDDNVKVDWNNPSDFEFKYELGIAPEFTLELPGKYKFTRYQPKVDESLINKQSDDYGRRYGKLINVEKAGERDMILGNFKELDESGNVIPEGFNHSSTISLEFINDKKSKKKLLGSQPKDTFKIDPVKISRGEADMAAMLGIDKERAKIYKREVLLTVNEVKTLEPANLDVALFDKIYGAGEVKTIEEFKSKVKDDLNKMFVADIDRLLKDEISTNLIKKLKIKLPDNFLKKWILSSNKEAKKEDIEKEYDRYAEGIKWQLIENFIIKIYLYNTYIAL